MICDVSWKGFVDFCGHARDGLEALEKGCSWRNISGNLSEEQLEYCQNLISHASLGLSLPGLKDDVSGLYSACSVSLEKGSYVNVSLQINKTVGGVLHVWKDLSALSYASLGALETPVELLCEITDMVGNLAELAGEVRETAWHVPYEKIVARVDFGSSKKGRVTVFTKANYEDSIRESSNRSWLLCLKTAAIATSVALGIIGITTLLGGGALVSALITPVGILALGSVGLVLKVAGNVFEKNVCGPCTTC